jgi:hypothetical protein
MDNLQAVLHRAENVDHTARYCARTCGNRTQRAGRTKLTPGCLQFKPPSKKQCEAAVRQTKKQCEAAVRQRPFLPGTVGV